MIRDYLLFAYRNTTKRSLRTWLTTIGIFIGIAAVVSLISLGQGLQTAILGQFSSLSADRLIVQNTGTAFGPPGSTVASKLNEHDIKITTTVKMPCGEENYFLFLGNIQDGVKIQRCYITKTFTDGPFRCYAAARYIDAPSLATSRYFYVFNSNLKSSEGYGPCVRLLGNATTIQQCFALADQAGFKSNFTLYGSGSVNATKVWRSSIPTTYPKNPNTVPIQIYSLKTFKIEK